MKSTVKLHSLLNSILEPKEGLDLGLCLAVRPSAVQTRLGWIKCKEDHPRRGVAGIFLIAHKVIRVGRNV